MIMQSNSSPIVNPDLDKIVVYSKPKCDNCEKVKLLLLDLVKEATISSNTVRIIDCDDILQRSRDTFINEMQQLTGQLKLTFPMVFAYGDYIGGFKEAVKYCEKINSFDNIQDF
jgi:glutaredoxin